MQAARVAAELKDECDLQTADAAARGSVDEGEGAVKNEATKRASTGRSGDLMEVDELVMLPVCPL